MQENYTAPRLVLAGAGVEHSELVNLAQDMLADAPAGKAAAKVPSKYVGGDFRQLAPSSPHTNVILAFEFAGGWNDIKVLPLLLHLGLARNHPTLARSHPDAVLLSTPLLPHVCESPFPWGALTPCSELRCTNGHS